MIIAMGSDHGGFKLKNEIIKHLENIGYKIKDFGVHNEQSVDYPDYGKAVAEAVASGEYAKGIVVCGTGIGISIAANKVVGIRAALCTDPYMAKMSREHNNSNILALGERVIGYGLALEIVDTWLSTNFAEGRHKIRVDKITAIEKSYYADK